MVELLDLVVEQVVVVLQLILDLVVEELEYWDKELLVHYQMVLAMLVLVDQMVHWEIQLMVLLVDYLVVVEVVVMGNLELSVVAMEHKVL
jgi:hypothetical protein